ncbi:MAG: hypothetical protein AAB354_17400 [candidate division KSB1 bacterium]
MSTRAFAIYIRAGEIVLRPSCVAQREMQLSAKPDPQRISPR